MTNSPTDTDPHYAELDAFGHGLVVSLVNFELYDGKGALVQDSLHKNLNKLNRLCEATGKTSVKLEFVGAQILIDERPLVGASLQAGKFRRLASERNVRALAFEVGLVADELGRFFELFTTEHSKAAFAPNLLAKALAMHGIDSVTIELTTDSENSGATTEAATGNEQTIERYQALADVLQTNHVAAHRGNSLEIDLAQGVVEKTMAHIARQPSELLALANYDDIDSFTVGHSVRVALLAIQVAKAAGASQQDLVLVGTAALLHDIGKSRIPQEILFKQGRLDSDEWAAMAEHPRLGGEILLEQPGVHPSAIGAAFCHHMAPENRGYPMPAFAFDPSGISKLVRVCDVFEALTAVRPYKQALTPVEAHVIMHRQRREFDSRWLKFFVQVIGLYPLGTRLELVTGDIVIVQSHGPECDQPIVQLLENSSGDDGVQADVGQSLVIGEAFEGRVPLVKEILGRRGPTEAQSSLVEVIGSIPQHACLKPSDHSH